MMEFVNAAQKWDALPRDAAETFALLLSPYAPHLAEELWNRMGHGTSLAYVTWPEHDESFLTEDEIEIIVQINGKMRGKCKVPADAEQDAVLAIVKEMEAVAQQLEGKSIRKEIYVPGRLVNLVVG